MCVKTTDSVLTSKARKFTSTQQMVTKTFLSIGSILRLFFLIFLLFLPLLLLSVFIFFFFFFFVVSLFSLCLLLLSSFPGLPSSASFDSFLFLHLFLLRHQILSHFYFFFYCRPNCRHPDIK